MNSDTKLPREHMPCLDGLRGLAAVMVVLGHAEAFHFPTIIFPGARDHGVFIFFALSGFLMGDLYLTRKFTFSNVCDYLGSRIARIVPIYYIIVLVSFIIYQLIDHNFTYRISGVHLIRLLTFNGSESVFWSIGPEFQFYFLFVPLWFLFARFQSKWVFAAVTIAISALCIATIRFWPGIIVFSKFHIFAAGMLFAVVRQFVLPVPKTWIVTLLHLVCGVLLAVIMFNETFSDLVGTRSDPLTDPTASAFYGSIPRTVLAGLIVLSFSYASPIGTLLFANPLAALLGRYSFSIYLLHMPVLYWLSRSPLNASLPPLALTLLGLILTTVLSSLSYALIEAPARRWGKQKFVRLALGTREHFKNGSAERIA